jgi:hypothetical protein
VQSRMAQLCRQAQSQLKAMDAMDGGMFSAIDHPACCERELETGLEYPLPGNLIWLLQSTVNCMPTSLL